MLAREQYGAGVDWYALGLIINEMVTGECTYHPALFHPSSSDAEDLIREDIDWVSVEALQMPPPHIPGLENPREDTSSCVIRDGVLLSLEEQQDRSEDGPSKTEEPGDAGISSQLIAPRSSLIRWKFALLKFSVL
ncbi:unnamed protein product, partial [Ranitomeya imitator]